MKINVRKGTSALFSNSFFFRCLSLTIWARRASQVALGIFGLSIMIEGNFSAMTDIRTTIPYQRVQIQVFRWFMVIDVCNLFCLERNKNNEMMRVTDSPNYGSIIWSWHYLFKECITDYIKSNQMQPLQHRFSIFKSKIQKPVNISIVILPRSV